MSGRVRTALEHSALVRARDALPGPIYVFGDPLILYLSGREQAVALNGWSPENSLVDQWVDLTKDLRAKAPVYVYVSDARFVGAKAPELVEWLDRSYEMARTQPHGTWHRRRAAGHTSERD